MQLSGTFLGDASPETLSGLLSFVHIQGLDRKILQGKLSAVALSQQGQLAGNPNLVSQNLALDVQSFQSFFHLFAAADRRGQTPVEPTQILSQLDEFFTWPNPQKSKLGVKLFK